MENVTLSNGVEMPLEGLGTFMMSQAQAEAATLEALKVGYVHVDTANAYQNEKAVGRGWKAAGVAREDFFLSTKLWPSMYGEAEAAIDSTLERLQTDYVDMLILHQPIGEIEHAWRAMEAANKAGRVRALGLSNFPREKVEEVLAFAEIKPQLLTTEVHPYFQEADLKAWLDSEGIVIEAWYPLGHGDKALLAEPVFAEIGGRYGKSPAQVILRWHTQRGISVIPGSNNPAHIADNLNIFDFALTDDEMASIAALDKGVRYYHPSDELLQQYLGIQLDLDAQE